MIDNELWLGAMCGDGSLVKPVNLPGSVMESVCRRLKLGVPGIDRSAVTRSNFGERLQLTDWNFGVLVRFLISVTTHL